jgi:hypothetical protein
MGVTAASRSKLSAVGRGAVPGMSPIVLICIRFGARTPNLRHRRYTRIQFHQRIKRRSQDTLFRGGERRLRGRVRHLPVSWYIRSPITFRCL